MRLRGGVFIAASYEYLTFIDLSPYPQWLVVLVGSLLAALLIWLMIKLLKGALWLLLFAVLIGGVAWAGWLLWKMGPRGSGVADPATLSTRLTPGPGLNRLKRLGYRQNRRGFAFGPHIRSEGVIQH